MEQQNANRFAEHLTDYAAQRRAQEGHPSIGYCPPRYENHDTYVYTAPPKDGFSISKLSVPLLLVLVGAAALVSATAAATSTWNNAFDEIKAAIGILEHKLDYVTSTLTRRVDELDVRSRDRWSRNDHALWCARTEKLNRGWTCDRDTEDAARLRATREPPLVDRDLPPVPGVVTGNKHLPNFTGSWKPLPLDNGK